MELFQRKESFKINGIFIEDLYEILLRRSNHLSIKKMLFDTLILSNDKRIKCICDYYAKNNNLKTPKRGKNLNCPIIQIFYGIDKEECDVYKCSICHRLAIEKLRDGELKLKK